MIHVQTDHPKMNLLTDENYHLQVYFVRPSEDIVQSNKAYRYVNFSHVGFYLPYSGCIWEITSQFMGMPQSSSDKYMPFNKSVKIILPTDLRKTNVDEICKKHVADYGNCVPFIVNVLAELELISKDFQSDFVDDLFFELSKKYRMPVQQIIEHFNKEKKLIADKLSSKEAKKQ